MAGQRPGALDTQTWTSEFRVGTRPQVTPLVWVCVTCVGFWSSLTWDFIYMKGSRMKKSLQTDTKHMFLNMEDSWEKFPIFSVSMMSRVNVKRHKVETSTDLLSWVNPLTRFSGWGLRGSYSDSENMKRKPQGSRNSTPPSNSQKPWLQGC